MSGKEPKKGRKNMGEEQEKSGETWRKGERRASDGREKGERRAREGWEMGERRAREGREKGERRAREEWEESQWRAGKGQAVTGFRHTWNLTLPDVESTHVWFLIEKVGLETGHLHWHEPGFKCTAPYVVVQVLSVQSVFSINLVKRNKKMFSLSIPWTHPTIISPLYRKMNRFISYHSATCVLISMWNTECLGGFPLLDDFQTDTHDTQA